MEILEKKIILDDADLLALLGYNDVYLHLIENRFQTVLLVRGNSIVVKGAPEEVKAIEAILKEMNYALKRSGSINMKEVETIIDLVDVGSKNAETLARDEYLIYRGAKDSIKARSPKQKEYVDKVARNDLVFAIGPAGTGKTFLAVAMALAALKKNEVERIILTRPAVEAGESLGFLPGDLNEKIDPYLRPLTDALHYMISGEKVKSLTERKIVEIIPLAYMRGRTLNRSFIILDEAQNSTKTQMKMFLTRLGFHSKAIVTGDVTQIDLHDRRNSGLIDVQDVLKNIDGLDFVYFSNKDVVRHKLVAEIIGAYEKDELKRMRHKTPGEDEIE